MKEDSKKTSSKRYMKGRVRRAKPGRYFGEYPGAPYGTTWKNRLECFDAGVHRQLEPGIHGVMGEGAYSIVVSGQYKDDKDNGDTILYTGSGGNIQYPDGMREQVQDQKWSDTGNEALRQSSIIGNPVRVIRGYELGSKFAPWEGFRYDGLYVCKRAWKEKNRDGYYDICRFTMERIPGQPPLRCRSSMFGLYQSSPTSIVNPDVAQPPAPAPLNARQRLRMEGQMSLQNMESFLSRSSR
jgi:hypothetical protein